MYNSLEHTIKNLVSEAMSPAQQAAIAISKKERGEKPKTEEVSKSKRRAMDKKMFKKVVLNMGDTDIEEPDEKKIGKIVKALNKSTKAHAKQADYFQGLLKKDAKNEEVDIDEDKVDVELDEGTWHLPETKKDMMKVIAMLKKPIPVGNEEDAYEGTEAEVGRKLNALGKAKIPIGDDEFYDNAYMLFKRKGANADLRPVAIEALARLGVISKAGTAMNAISDIQKRIKSMNEETLGEELTMMSHGGEQTHIISGMKHNQHNADKAMHATVHAAAKHAGVHVDKIKHHQEIMSNVMDDEHHYMRHEPVKKGTSSDDKAGRGGHGEVHHHKDLASYVNHHAKNDAQEYKDRHHYYEESVQSKESYLGHSDAEKLNGGKSRDPNFKSSASHIDYHHRQTGGHMKSGGDADMHRHQVAKKLGYKVEELQTLPATNETLFHRFIQKQFGLNDVELDEDIVRHADVKMIKQKNPDGSVSMRRERPVIKVGEKLDPVNKKAAMKNFKDRKDKDVDNDGDVDSTDKYLHKRRQAITKNIAKTKTEGTMSLGQKFGISDKLLETIKGVVSDDDMVKKNDPFINRLNEKLSSKEKMKRGMYNDAHKDAENKMMKKNGGDKMDKIKMEPEMESTGDKVAPDQGSSGIHRCASQVAHEQYGNGECIFGEHAEPDRYGNVAWYDVMFEHGIEKGVPISELSVKTEKEHGMGGHKKKK